MGLADLGFSDDVLEVMAMGGFFGIAFGLGVGWFSLEKTRLDARRSLAWKVQSNAERQVFSLKGPGYGLEAMAADGQRLAVADADG